MVSVNYVVAQTEEPHVRATLQSQLYHINSTISRVHYARLATQSVCKSRILFAVRVSVFWIIHEHVTCAVGYGCI